ncbi:unnamed protein product [Calypogeia fissa]
MDSFEGMDLESSNPRRKGETDDGAHQTQQVRLSGQEKSWRFTYEALTRVHSLRLFLFNSMIPVPWRCASLQATLASESESMVSSSPVVLCQWNSPNGDSYKLFVPIPVCLIDYSVPFLAFARSDHIEIKLTLLSSGGSFVDDLSLLGFTYKGEPVDSHSHGGEAAESALSLNSDAELLTSKQKVTFYCRNCSVELIKEPISCFRALPSTEWRELADHWFGVCCCRDGVHTKSLMTRFDELMTPTSGVCLVGSTICIIHRDDLVRKMVDSIQHTSVDLQAQCCTPVTESNDDLRRTGDGPDTGLNGTENHHVSGNGLRPLNNPAMTSNGHSHEALEDSSTYCTSPAARHENLDSNIDELAGAAVTTTSGSHHNAMDEAVEPRGCCSGSGANHGNGVSDDLPDNAVKAKTIANGFMSGFPSSKLTPFECHNCASLVGVCPGGTEEGLQLFKCHISSDISACAPSDVFRFHTLERVFSNELLTNAEEDSSYRYIVRDMNSRLPLLQLVIINHESWNCSGFCKEEQRLVSTAEDDANGTFSCQNSRSLTTKGNQKLFLEPVMKVLLCDTSSFSSEELAEVERWGQKNQADDVYMLDSEVMSLARSLQANRKLFPESSAAFQQFHFSFLAR